MITLEYYNLLANTAARLSHADKKVGAVVASKNGNYVSFGYNDEETGTHAEIMAIRNSTFNTNGATLVCTWFPCHDCAVFIKCSHITRVVAPKPDLAHHRWGDSWLAATRLFKQHGIEIVYTEDLNDDWVPRT